LRRTLGGLLDVLGDHPLGVTATPGADPGLDHQVGQAGRGRFRTGAWRRGRKAGEDLLGEPPQRRRDVGGGQRLVKLAERDRHRLIDQGRPHRRFGRRVDATDGGLLWNRCPRGHGHGDRRGAGQQPAHRLADSST
jgi:hypothetical protein